MNLRSLIGALPPWAPYGLAVPGLLLLRGIARASHDDTKPAPPRPQTPAPTIRLGSVGPAVAYWRWVVGLPPSPANFDQATHGATVSWQRARGLAADGVVGPATWAAAGVAGGSPAPGHPPHHPPQQGPAPTPPPPPAPQPAPPPTQPAPPSAENVFGLAEGISQREQQILALVGAGEFEHHWHPLTWTVNGRTVRALVSREPVMLKRGDHRLYVSTTFPTAQKIGDMIGGSMLTTKISDEIHRQAPVKLAPHVRNWSADKTMAQTVRMVQQSAALRAAVAGREEELKSNLFKDWVLTRRHWPAPAGTGQEEPEGSPGSRHNGANFGWYLPQAPSKSPGGERVIQSVGLMHNMHHTDYSQGLRYVKKDSITVDGVPVGYATALADPVLSPLLQDEGGILPSDRHPDL